MRQAVSEMTDKSDSIPPALSPLNVTVNSYHNLGYHYQEALSVGH